MFKAILIFICVNLQIWYNILFWPMKEKSHIQDKILIEGTNSLCVLPLSSFIKDVEGPDSL